MAKKAWGNRRKSSKAIILKMVMKDMYILKMIMTILRKKRNLKMKEKVSHVLVVHPLA